MRQPYAVAGFTIVALIALAVLLAGQVQPPARATEDTLSALVGDLWDRVLEERTSDTSSDFTFTIEFNQSVAGIGSSVTMGQGLNTQRIDRVGADYFCLSRVFSRDLVNDCIPLSNITKINYREEQ